MNVLMIGGDKNMLTQGTEAAKRLELQRKAVDRLDLFVWPQKHGVREILRAARATKYDVVTVQDPFWRGLVALYIAWRTKATLNVQVHTDLAVQGLVRHVLAQIVLRHADSVRVVSEKIKAQVERMGTAARIAVLPVYIDLAPYQSLVHHKHPRFFRTILWIGRFESEKDPIEAISVLAKARKEGIDACLIMLGEGSLKAALMRKAEQFVKCIEFPGWSNPAPYLAMADVVVSTSKHESYGVSMIEALAAGVPVVAPDVGIAREAGATVVPRAKLAETVVEVLQRGGRASLKLPILEAAEWARRWRESL